MVERDCSDVYGLDTHRMCIRTVERLQSDLADTKIQRLWPEMLRVSTSSPGRSVRGVRPWCWGAKKKLADEARAT